MFIFSVLYMYVHLFGQLYFSKYIVLFTLIFVVSVAPGDLMTMPTNTTVTFSWSPPSDPNGIIFEYVIVLMLDMMEINNMSVSNMTMDTEFMDLTPFTNYTVTVRALTGEEGEIKGEIAMNMFMTDTGGEY